MIRFLVAYTGRHDMMRLLAEAVMDVGVLHVRRAPADPSR
jgi:hypothetical protein